MNKYISLLRGINVSGKKIIKMSDLKLHYESLGFNNVQTYIQSGNAIFCSDEDNIKTVQRKIEDRIKEVYNFSVPVLVLSKREIEQIILKVPFDLNIVDITKLAVIFLETTPVKSLVKEILPFSTKTEQFVIIRDVIYFNCTIGFGKTKLTNNFFEKKLKVTATSRNWKTTSKLLQLITETECGTKF